MLPSTAARTTKADVSYGAPGSGGESGVFVGVDDLASCTRLKPTSLWLDGILDNYDSWKGLSEVKAERLAQIMD
jgi:hypothetical protein